jgi:hypothetical protein
MRSRALERWRTKPASTRRKPARTCACGAALTDRRRRCDACKQERQRARDCWRGAKKRGVARPVEARVSPQRIAERDGWRCHLCRRRVSRLLVAPHPRSASIDHLVPLVDGGSHEPVNLRLAHPGCNSRRGASGPAQLLLVG